MSVQSQIEHLLNSYIQAFNARDMKIIDLFQGRGDVYTPYSRPSIGHRELRALHAKWFEQDITYKAATVQHFTSREGAAYCFASYSLIHPEGDGDERMETGSSASIMIEEAEGRWVFLSTSIFPDET
ncbi:hypothetical protein TRL7639_00367 [Falsiruegeria litorea R37]|uniref:SnoaL-like domain-containing protein n=1 Tax=Falsiruegeria litorea R37 TaxID=1200284 RepID=A0A1Y5RIF2_9RHOB|nr:hypothetical protein [Falsiruegeria litorea]SLN18285.1 hypothetical protein TRL7639_00367 [Falsiruegeria litorea R37]